MSAFTRRASSQLVNVLAPSTPATSGSRGTMGRPPAVMRAFSKGSAVPSASTAARSATSSRTTSAPRIGSTWFVS